MSVCRIGPHPHTPAPTRVRARPPHGCAGTGRRWRAAELGQGSEQPLHKAWAWTFWEAEVPAPSGGERTTLICKAFDAAHNTQPETAASIWNLRGLANNSWHRVRVALVQDTD